MLKITANIEIDELYDTPGVYVYFKNGYMTDDESYTKKHKKDAIGVAVIAEVEGKLHRIIIDKTDVDNGYGVYYGGYRKKIEGAVTTKDKTTTAKDMNGKANTIAISDACHEYCDGYRTKSAAEDCQKRFDGKGYLPSIGEWQMLYDNKDTVEKMMSIIGGTALGSKFYWSSTLYDASNTSWNFYWYNGNTYFYNRNGDGICVRAVMEI